MEPLSYVTVSRCLSLFLFFAVLSLARGQECPVIQQSELGSTTTPGTSGLIADAVTLGDSGSAPDILVLDSRTVCLAAGPTRDRYRYASVVVSFNCSGSLAPGNALGISTCDGELAVQFDFECVAGPQWQRALTLGGDNVFNPSNGNLTTSLRTDCSFCADPDEAGSLGLTVDMATHCADCDDTCRDPPDGLGFCTGILAIGCCNFYQDNTCVVTCPDGYEEVDGMDCVQLCPTLTAPDNGMVTVTSRTLNSEATYSCDAGYMLDGSATRTCEEAQESTGLVWSGSAPTCMIRDCGTPPTIDNATPMTPTGTTFEATAVYACNENYELEDPSVDTLTCGATGTWDGPRPACVSLCSCLNGDCVDGVCVCPPGYTGSDCGEQLCIPSCLNGGCNNGVCVCPPGYTGSVCGVQLCVPECLNGGTCNDGECECPEGFAKPICQPCPPNCKECLTNDTCVVCEDGSVPDPVFLCDKIEEQSGGGGGGGCDIGCIIGIIIALLVVLALIAIIAGVIYGLYRYQSNPTTKLKNKDTEGLNGVARDNPLYVDPSTVEEEVEAAAVAPAQDGEP